MERRAYERAPASLPVKLLLGNIYDSCDTKNLSKTGMFLNTWKPLPLGLKIGLLIPSRNNVKVSARVARLVEKDDLFDGMGVEILDPSREYLECVDVFMRKQNMKIVFKIDDEIINRTTKCLRNFDCLKNGGKEICGVDSSLQGDSLFIDEKSREYCSYMMPFGTSAQICTCPTRREIFARFNF
jgi:hypothetical protein